MAFEMSHQVTGYTVAASLFTATNIDRALVLGLGLPLPRVISDGFTIEAVRRPSHMKVGWLQWLNYTVNLHDKYKGDIHTAPKHTHSCNRYFRPCSMIPFCTSDLDEQKHMLSQMTTEEWSPLHEQGTSD